jgi:hypothetical protein
MNKKEYREILEYLYLDPIYIKVKDEYGSSCIIEFMFDKLEKYYRKVNLEYVLDNNCGCLVCKLNSIRQGTHYLNST